MQVASWNVNSIRTRLDHVTNWLSAHPVDLLCLQETKVVDQDFPLTAFEAVGYRAYVYGQKAYNGVALISREPLEAVSMGFRAVLDAATVGDLDDQKRVISGRLNGVRIVNLYVPNGASVGSDKYDYKLRWLGVLKQYLTQVLAENAAVNVCGDFNVAPENKDIHSDKNRDKHIMSSPVEREALRDVLSVGLSDAFRKFTDEGGHYTWWDYRSGSFPKNLGWRIDHHYLSPALYERATRCYIDAVPRGLEKPSDHVPIVVEY
ncbi:MAG: exodeoxyribonuclease III [Leptolyngbya sp. SIO4C1]|nr:exodeoxyribonuclease III [Leptolyngbya sp. SIO4C1]